MAQGRLLAAALAFAALVSSPERAQANGRFPATNHLVVRPGHPDHLLLRATFGLLSSTDGGATWHWVCERAVGFNGVQDPPLVYTEQGAVLAALFEGLAIAPKGPCAFAPAAGLLAGQVAVDITAFPGEPEGALVLTGSFAGSDGGVSQYRSALFHTADGGRTFEALGRPLDPTLIVETVEVSRRDPKRVYVTAIRGDGPGAKGVLLRSNDGGRTWTELAVPLEAGERAPFIAGVDPERRDRVYLRTSGTGQQRLLATDDGGRTLRTIHRGEKLLGFALSPDGKTVYVGSPKGGLLAADRDTLAFEKRASVEVQCLTVTDQELYACSNEASGFLVGRSVDGGRTFAPLLRFTTIRGVLPCEGTEAGSRLALCKTEWPVLKQELAIPDEDGGAATRDGGAAGGATGPGTTPAKTSSSAGRCGCRAAPRELSPWSLAGGLFAGVLAWQRRRRGSLARRRTDV